MTRDQLEIRLSQLREAGAAMQEQATALQRKILMQAGAIQAVERLLQDEVEPPLPAEAATSVESE